MGLRMPFSWPDVNELTNLLRALNASERHGGVSRGIWFGRALDPGRMWNVDGLARSITSSVCTLN